MTLIALSFLGCTPVQHTESLAATTALPEIDASCAPDDSDVTLDDGTRVVTRTRRDGDTCRADVYVRSNLVDWGTVDDALNGDGGGGVDVDWSDVTGTFDSLALTVVSGESPPEGTEVVVSQLVAGSVTQGDIDADPAALLDDVAGLADDPNFLLGFDAVLAGETDLTETADISHQNPVGAVTRSWNEDRGMTLVTVATVAVPLDILAELGATDLALDVAESVTFSGKVNFHAFGGDE